jgi:hypothetical protein
MQEDLVKVEAILDSISTLKDRSIKMVFYTQEVGAEQGFKLFSMRNSYGWLLFKDNPIQKEDIPDDDALEFAKMKTSSQRLRSTLFVLWNQLGRPGEFDPFYKREMEAFIESVKARLES